MATRARAKPARGLVMRLAPIQAGLTALALLVALAGVVTAIGMARHAPRLGLLANSGGRVLMVDPDGVAAQSGIRVGDRIVAVDGEAWAGHGFTALGGLAVGDALGVVEGGPGRFMLFQPTVGAPSATETAGDAAALVVALVLWLSGLVGAFSRRLASAARLYGLAALSLSLACCSLAASGGAAIWPPATLVPAVIVGLAALLLAQSALAAPPPITLVAPVAVIAGGTALAAGMSAFVAAPRFVSWASYSLIIVLALAALAAPAVAHGLTRAARPRRRLRVALLAGLIGLGPACAWPGALALGGDTGWMPTVPDAGHASPLWGLVGLASMAALYAATLLAPDARRLDTVALVGLSYLAAIVACIGAFALATQALPGPARVAAIVAIVAAFPVLQYAAARALRRVAREARPDYRAATRAVEALPVHETSLRDAAQRAAALLPALLAVEDCAVLVCGLDCADDRYRVVASGAHMDAVVTLDAPLVGASALESRPLAAQESERVARALKGVPAIDATVWLSLWWDGAQRAAVALGQPLSGAPFEAADLEALDALGRVLALALQGVDLTGRLQERTTTLTALARRLADAHEQERAHLSRELHDVVAQELIALTRQLRRYGAGRTPPADIWDDMLAASQDALTTIRRICNGLRPAILDLGIVPALRDLVARATDEGGTTEASLSVDGTERRLDADVEFALFRVAQEGLNNAVRHADARQVRVEIVFDRDVWLRVRDDGRGFTVPVRFEDLPGDHLGLIGMRERLAEFGGTLAMRSAPGHGTVLEAHVPQPNGKE